MADDGDEAVDVAVDCAGEKVFEVDEEVSCVEGKFVGGAGREFCSGFSRRESMEACESGRLWGRLAVTLTFGCGEPKKCG